VTGPDAGISFELPALGNMSYENLVASPSTGDKTVVAALDDSTGGQVYF
jgi:secreted PhoX family phosphatase